MIAVKLALVFALAITAIPSNLAFKAEDFKASGAARCNALDQLLTSVHAC